MNIPGRVWLLLLMILVGVAPMVSVLSAGMIAEANGCPLHEGFVQPCIVFGQDIGPALYTMTTMGWLMLISLFFLAGGLLGLAKELFVLLARTVRAKLRG